MQRAKVYVRALRASQNRKEDREVLLRFDQYYTTHFAPGCFRRKWISNPKERFKCSLGLVRRMAPSLACVSSLLASKSVRR